MKKLIFFLAIVLTLSANAQLTVFENGKVHVGNVSSDQTPSQADLTISSVNQTGGILVNSASKGTIASGSSATANISGGGALKTLDLYGSSGINFGLGKTLDVIRISGLTETFTSSVEQPYLLPPIDKN